jgi:hypothetical protein
MAEQYKMQKQNHDQEWIVAYYDLLGIKAEMRKWTAPDGTINKLDIFRQKIKDLVNGINQSIQKRNQNEPNLQKTRECELVTFGFADTMVVASRIVNRYDNPQLMALSMMLMAMIPLAAWLLKEGILFRAGVEVGKARLIKRVSDYFPKNAGAAAPAGSSDTRVFEGDLCGPAYIAAHDLASLPGSPPGVYVGSAAVSLIEEAASGQGRFEGAWISNAQQARKSLMRLDSKNKYRQSESGDIWAVDFANLYGIMGEKRNDPRYAQTRCQLKTGYDRILSELKPGGQTDEKIRNKLLWVKEYLEGRNI